MRINLAVVGRALAALALSAAFAGAQSTQHFETHQDGEAEDEDAANAEPAPAPAPARAAPRVFHAHPGTHAESNADGNPIADAPPAAKPSNPSTPQSALPGAVQFAPGTGVTEAGGNASYGGSRFSVDQQLLAALSNCCGNSAGATAGNRELMRQFGITDSNYWERPQFRQLMDLDSQSPVLRSSAQQLLFGKSPEQVYAGIQKAAQVYGANNLDQAPSLANLKRMRQMMDQYGFKADTNLGYPIDSPFNPNNPNSVFNKSNPESKFSNGKTLDQNSGGCDGSLHPSPQMIQDEARYGRKPAGYAAEGGSGLDKAGNPLGAYTGAACTGR
jgi:hypothetical protein